MPLIVENGSIVTGANSYVTRSDYLIFANLRGVTIADDAAADAELVKAAEYIDMHEANLKGYRSTRDQPMSYPRTNVVLENWYWNSDEIPRQVSYCQYALALDIHAGIDLYNRPANPNLVARKQRVEGAVSVEFAVKDGADQKATYTSTADAWMNMLLKNNGLRLVELNRS